MANDAHDKFYSSAEEVARLAEKIIERYESDLRLDPVLARHLAIEAENVAGPARVLSAEEELVSQNIQDIAAMARYLSSLFEPSERLQYAMYELNFLSGQLFIILRSLGSYDRDTLMPVRIYVEDTAVGPVVEERLHNLLARVGVVEMNGPDPLLGSWYHRMFGTIKAAGNTRTGQELRRATEIQLIDRFQAGIDEVTAGAVSSLIAALDNTKGAVIQTGSVLLVKVNDNIVVRQLTPEQLLHWHMNPGIFQDPVAALNELQRTVQTEVDSAR